MISAIYLIRSTDVYYTCWYSVKYMHSNKTQITHENLFISQTKSQAFIMSESKSSLRSIIVRLQVINAAEQKNVILWKTFEGRSVLKSTQSRTWVEVVVKKMAFEY